MRLDCCMHIFRRVQAWMEEPSKEKRQIGLTLVQIGLPVIFFAGSNGKVGALGGGVEIVAYALYVIGCGFFFAGHGGTFFETGCVFLRILFAMLLLIFPGIITAMDMHENAKIPHDMQILLFLVIQGGAPLLVWIGERRFIQGGRSR